LLTTGSDRDVYMYDLWSTIKQTYMPFQTVLNWANPDVKEGKFVY